MDCLLYCLLCIELKTYGADHAPVIEIDTAQFMVMYYQRDFDSEVAALCTEENIRLMDAAYAAVYITENELLNK